MATIDDKVVSIAFESSKFESGVTKTISALDKLKAALHFGKVGESSMAQISHAAKAVDVSHIGKGVEEVSSKLNALRLTAIAVFAGIASKALEAGKSLIGAFTLEPLKVGYQEYATNLNAVQTILANTQAAGVGIKEVNATLKELNEYSDKTIYNFSQMAKNIGTFTAAGVELKTATASIKGIANLAALSGSNAEQASTAMYQLSQAIASGKVGLMDWNSVVNANMGGAVFQRALAQTAVAMGTLKENAVKLEGPMKTVKIQGMAFRNSLSLKGAKGDNWLTSGVLTSTLKQFTGDLKDSELAAQGFNKEQIKAIQATAQTAMLAATNVKTLSQVLQVAKETAGSGWAETWKIVFGDFAEAKTTFTALSNTINGFINTNADARNKVLEDWKALGGRTHLINTIKIAFHNLGMIIKPIKEAFRDIFPPITAKNLIALNHAFRDFANALKPGQKTMENLKRTFAGVFAVFSIAKQIIFGLVGVFVDLFSTLGTGTGGFLEFTGSIGDFLVKVDQALKKGEYLENFFEGLAKVLAAPIKFLLGLAGAFKGLFKISPGGLSGEISVLGRAMEFLQGVLESLMSVWDSFMGGMDGADQVLGPIFEAIGDGISSVGVAIGQALSQMSFEPILAVIRTGLLAGLVLMFKNFLGKGSAIDQITKGFGGGILANISGSLGALRGSLVAMQQNIKAKTLKEIAIAVALLAASMFVLSLIDPKKLGSALTAMTVAFAELLGAMAVLTKITGTKGFLAMPFITASMILLAGAIDILALAVLALSRLSWNELLKGLSGVAASLGIMVVAMKPLAASSPGLIRAGVGITAIAVGLRIMASAISAMGALNLKELAKGLGGVAVSLGILVAATNKIPSGGMIGIGVGLIAVAVALRILANAVEAFGGMDLKTMGKGMAAVGVALAIIGGAMRIMPPHMVLMGAGLVLVAGALNVMAKAIASMGGMSVKQIAKGLLTLAYSLGVLAGMLTLMTGTIGGAAALSVAAGALALLVPVLITLGHQKWTTIVKGLIFLAAALGAIALATNLLAPAIPAMLGFGIALVAIGAGIALVGAGLWLIAAAISMLVVALPSGVGILIAAISEFQDHMVEFAKNFILGLLEIVNMIAVVAPKFVDAFVKIIGTLIDALIKLAPKVAEAFTALLTAGIQILAENRGQIIQAGFELILALLAGIQNNIGKVVTAVVGIVVKFINALGTQLSKIVLAGLNLLVAFLKGIANGLGRVVTAALSIVTKIITTITGVLGKIVTLGLTVLLKLLSGIANNLGQVIKAGTDVIVKFVQGIGDAGVRIVRAGREAASKFIKTLADEIVKLADDVFEALITLINGMATTIENRAPELRAAGQALGWAIADGMTFGLAGKAKAVAEKAFSLGRGAIGALRRATGTDSPSKEALSVGKFVVEGFAIGLSKSVKSDEAAKSMGQGAITAVKNVLQVTSPSKVMIEIGKAVGQGFAIGIRGSADDIRSAFADLNAKLTDQMVTSREIIAEEQKKLDELRESKKPDAKAIKEAQAVIKENEELLKRATAGHMLLTKALRDEKAELITLANDYERIGKQLEDAKTALADLIQQKKDYHQSLVDQYSAVPELSDPMVEEIKDARGAIAQEQEKLNKELAEAKQDPEKIAAARADIIAAQLAFDKLVAGKVLNAEGTAVDQLATYALALQNQTTAVGAYQATLQQLRKLGLDDVTYQKLLTEGPADQSFANQLLAGGKTAVKSLNTLDANLKKVSETLATHAAANLKDAGIKSAKGLVKGLKEQHNDIRKEMETIARIMINSLKKELGIKSPSEEFAKLGRNSMEGFAKGFTDSKNVMKDATKDVMGAIQQSMRDITDAVSDELILDPVITPILDLTQVKAQAGELGSLTGVVPITAAASYGQASLISSQQTAAQMDETVAATPGTSVKFEQNNYSPESLTEIEIYRQTKNQLSQLKSVLAIT